MIRALKIRNFQRHRELRCSFSSGITTIKGPTDAGKSALLRALRWVCLNDFAGEDFIRSGARNSLIQILVDGKVITRRKGAKGNLYKLNEAVFKSFGQGKVPDTIANLLSLSEINFQGQFDPHFWLAESPPEVSRQLNRVVDLSIIDETLSRIGATVREASFQKKFSEGRLKEAKELLQGLERQKKRVKEFEALKNTNDELQKITADRDQLGRVLRDIDSNRYRTHLQQSLESASVFKAARNLRAQVRSIRTLEGLLESAAELRAKVEPPPDLEPLEESFKKLRRLDARVESFADLIWSHTNQEARHLILRRQLKKAEDLFHEAAAGRNCPICGHKIKTSQAKCTP